VERHEGFARTLLVKREDRAYEDLQKDRYTKGILDKKKQRRECQGRGEGGTGTPDHDRY